MRNPMKWLALTAMGCCLILLQALAHQTTEIERLRHRSRAHYKAISAVQAQHDALRIETSVRDVLDAHNINVARSRQRQIAQSIIDIGHRYELEPELILAMIFTESRFDIHAVSEAGAIGLMQLRPATARAIAEQLELEWRGQDLLTDPQVNILLGTSYLHAMLERYEAHGLDYALAAYNVGPSKFDRLRRRGNMPVRYARQVRKMTEDLRADYFTDEPFR